MFTGRLGTCCNQRRDGTCCQHALDREGGTPRERLAKGTPVLQAADDVYTNHVHADDLARATVLALWRGQALRVLNVNDDSDLHMADYMDLAASLWHMTLSFMSESRRMNNQRLKQSLRYKLRYPTVREGLLGQPVF